MISYTKVYKKFRSHHSGCPCVAQHVSDKFCQVNRLIIAVTLQKSLFFKSVEITDLRKTFTSYCTFKLFKKRLNEQTKMYGKVLKDSAGSGSFSCVVLARSVP